MKKKAQTNKHICKTQYKLCPILMLSKLLGSRECNVDGSIIWLGKEPFSKFLSISVSTNHLSPSIIIYIVRFKKIMLNSTFLYKHITGYKDCLLVWHVLNNSDLFSCILVKRLGIVFFLFLKV